MQIFACVSCDLASALSAYFEAAASETAENLPVNLISEWKEFFSEGIHNLLLPLLVKVTGKYMARRVTSGYSEVELDRPYFLIYRNIMST